MKLYCIEAIKTDRVFAGSSSHQGQLDFFIRHNKMIWFLISLYILLDSWPYGDLKTPATHKSANFESHRAFPMSLWKDRDWIDRKSLSAGFWALGNDRRCIRLFVANVRFVAFKSENGSKWIECFFNYATNALCAGIKITICIHLCDWNWTNVAGGVRCNGADRMHPPQDARRMENVWNAHAQQVDTSAIAIVC